MESYFMGIIRKQEARIKALEIEIARAHAETVTVRNHWIEVAEDLDKECQKKLIKTEKVLTKMEKRALNAERQRDDALVKLKEERLEKYKLGAELEEEKGKSIKLTTQLNHNYENSSIPSSMSTNRKKISNSREKTGRKQGAQPGHKGYGRKKHVPTKVVNLPVPEEVLNNCDFRKPKRLS